MTPKYDLGERIFDGGHSQIFRGRRRADGAPVVLKRLRERHPTPASVAAFAREFDITVAAAGEGVIAAYELLAADALVLEDFGARSLALIARERRFAVEEVLAIALQVCDALARVHRLDIVHRDINPSNLVMNEATGVVKIIDFGISQVVTRESAAGFDGTPRYVSPEQTGRMNRPVDHRSDLYSLGVTLYELLAGVAPFDSRDRLELVHAHIAKVPTPVHELAPAVPLALSRVVATLLQKQAEQRYRGARGLRHDLARCAEQLRDGRRARAFVLREADLDERLRVPQALYGREREVAALSEACKGAADGPARVLLVGGYSGIGKTSLVREVRRLLAGGRARAAEGKYDQFQRAEPYAGVVRALRDLARQLLTEPDEALAAVRARVLEAVRGNGRVLTELVEELAGVLGPQPEVEALPPAEARNRLHHAVAALVRALATADRPLVLFLDDLQWADLPSFELLEAVASDAGLRHALVVGAYRDNEVHADHALVAWVEALRRAVEVDTIALGPLREDDVLRLVSDAVHAAPGHLRLAATCYDRTRGNAFYLNRFLEALYEDGLLRFDPAAGEWRWDLAAIAARPVTENVVDFLAERIRRMQPEERACLLHAAVIGDRFDLDALAAARGASRRDTLAALAGAIRAELVQPEAQGFWYVRDVDEEHTNFAWRFAHDRIRHAAHALLEPEAAALAHARVGRHLLARLDAGELEHRVFELVAHLQVARSMLDADERARLEELQLLAGRRALASAAFEAAHAALGSALAAMEPEAWETRYPRALALHLEGARAAWLSGARVEAERLVRVVLARAASVLDRVAAREVELDALVAQQRLGDAVATALDVLRELGVVFPDEPTDADVGAAVGATLGALEAQSPAAILALPEVHDARVAVAMRIQNAIMSSSYLARPRLFPLIVCSLVQSTLAHGVTRQSPYGFAVFGLVLVAINRIAQGQTLGETALKLLDRWDERAGRARVEHVVFNQVKSYVEPLRTTVDAQQRVFRLGLDTGDLEYAAWGLQTVCCNGFYAGIDLADLGPRIERHVAWMRRHEQAPALACSTPWGALIAALTRDAPGSPPWRLAGPGYDEDAEMARLRAQGFRGAASVLTAARVFARYLFRDHAGALAAADEGAEFRDGAVATYHIVWWHQFRALAHLALGRAPDELAATRAQMRVWLECSPQNHQHRVDLLEAEIARVEGRAADAMALYESAIAHARQNRFLHEEALANELAGRFYAARGASTPAAAYLHQSGWLWARWGASAKAAHLEAEFAGILSGARTSGGAVTRAGTDPTRTTGSTSGRVDDLDHETLFKAASAISSEIQLDRLLARSLEVAMENAGATRGLLLLEEDGALRVAASRAVDAGADIAPGTRLSDCPALVINVASYVARAGSVVLVADVREDPQWQATAAAQLERPTSVLCLPVAHKGTRAGVIYLENDLSAGAFTAQRAQLLALLASQAAIALENARLYRHLERSLETQVRLTNAHRRFVPHPFLEHLGRNDLSEVRLGDSVRKEMSILFADMREFTRHVRGMSGSENIEFINSYLGYMEPPVHRHGGFVDSYVGDAIMALFDDADAALQAALGMLAALGALNAARGGATITCGFGVNTGELTLGAIGTENRVKCGVIGDCVNVASRVESLTRHYGVPLLTTAQTRSALRRAYQTRFVDRVVVKGHTEPVALYEVFDADPSPLRAAKARVAERYERAVERYYARAFDAARAELEGCREALPDDRVVALFLERCARRIASPPGDDWTGVEVLLHK